MTTTTQIAIPRKEAILQIAEQMKATEGKSYSLNYINNRMKCENGKWSMESKRYRYEITDGHDAGSLPDAGSRQ